MLKKILLLHNQIAFLSFPSILIFFQLGMFQEEKGQSFLCTTKLNQTIRAHGGPLRRGVPLQVLFSSTVGTATAVALFVSAAATAGELPSSSAALRLKTVPQWKFLTSKQVKPYFCSGARIKNSNHKKWHYFNVT